MDGIKNDDWTVVQKLLGKHNINSVFVKAISNNSTKIVQMLLKEKENIVEIRTLSDNTPLHLAVMVDTKLVKILLDNGADINAKNMEGNTVLDYALIRSEEKNNDVGIVDFLIAKGVEIDGNQKIEMFLRWAARKNECDIARKLLRIKRIKINDPDDNDRTALMLAALNGHKEIVELLLQHGADFDAKDKEGKTALMLSLLRRNMDIAKLLLQHGANVDAKDKEGKTALIVAAKNGNMEVVKLLLQHGANVVNVKDNEGKTALALGINFVEITAELLVRICITEGTNKAIEEYDAAKTQETNHNKEQQLLEKLRSIILDFYGVGKKELFLFTAEMIIDNLIAINKEDKISELPLPQSLRQHLEKTKHHYHLSAEQVFECKNLECLLEHFQQIETNLNELEVSPINQENQRL
ncbi:MAG: ankyrin repeat domain-containing protein [Rickettsiaceae bacterium H1]|nr:ankyrin repeat domain-containing protein [Rickettsiaceae bacterium H1]